MRNPDHIEILTQGIDTWNKWRTRELGDKYGWTKYVFLNDADLRGFDLTRAILGDHEQESDIIVVYLNNADLRDACLYFADLRGAMLTSSKLTGANLNYAHLGESYLVDANLKNASMIGTNLSGANFYRANFEGVIFDRTIIADTILKDALGLESCIHQGPSILDSKTIAQSGNLPVEFLRGCGLSEAQIEEIGFHDKDRMKFCSCFISYSHKDIDLAQRLYADLQDHGVHCWFAPEDMKIGNKIRLEIDRAIHQHTKLLLILSETSVKSQWVEQEVETGLSRENKEKQIILFPIRIDNAVMEDNAGWSSYLKNTRHIGDFTKWKTQDSYQKSLNRLLRDLKTEADAGKETK